MQTERGLEAGDGTIDLTARLVAGDGSILALNNANAEALSRLDADRLAALVSVAFHAQGLGAEPPGKVDAFLLAFDQDADYRSPNFLWFRARLSRFVYVDRVVVAPEARRRGLARRLYADLIAHAADAGHSVVTCEVNAVPPNPISDAFHAALGFTELRSARLDDTGKTVRYLAKTLEPAALRT